MMEEQLVKKNFESAKSAKRLRIFCKFILILGIIAGIIILIVTFKIDNPEFGHRYFASRYLFNPMSIVYSLSIILSSVITYLFGNAVADIVDYLKKISGDEDLNAEEKGKMEFFQKNK